MPGLLPWAFQPLDRSLQHPSPLLTLVQVLDFLKVDVEGAEELLFGPEGDCDEWLPFVTCLSMEIHQQALPQGWEKAVFQPAMQRHGFKFALASGELAVWCNSKRYPGEATARVAQL
jgi:hypothetical protein